MLPDFDEPKETQSKSLYFEEEPDLSRIPGSWHERFVISERNYRLLESNYRILLQENSVLAMSLHQSSAELKALKSRDSAKGFGNEELRRDNKILARKCQDLLQDLEESKLNNSSEKIIELNSLILLLMSENDRLHGIIDEFYSPNREKLSESVEIIGSFSDQITLQQEIMKWKSRYYKIERNLNEINDESKKIRENMGAILGENEALTLKSRERETEIQRLRESLRESESVAILVNEINEKMERLAGENQRLKDIIIKRCRDLASQTWNF